MPEEDDKEKWYLYVLRYNFSGNYYVGITNDLKKRMLVHWRRTSIKRKLPIWSKMNKSTKGFRFYWFNINSTDVSQSYADHCENKFAEKILKKIKDINNEKFIKKVYVGNGNCIDRKYNYCTKIEINDIKNEFNYIDEVIAYYLIDSEKLGFKENEVQIECCNIGYLGEYDHSQCNKSWSDVAIIEFSIDNNEK